MVADLDLAVRHRPASISIRIRCRESPKRIATPERLDEVLLDRLLTKCSEHLAIFAAPVVLDRDYDISADACDVVLDVVRQNVPYVAVDLPHIWTPWVKRVLLQADDVVITAAPDLANLRNAKNMIDLVKQARNNDKPPRLVLNMVGMPKRPEISVKEFARAHRHRSRPAIIEFDSETFGQAANNGQMIEELSAKAKRGAVPRSRDDARSSPKGGASRRPRKRRAVLDAASSAEVEDSSAKESWHVRQAHERSGAPRRPESRAIRRVGARPSLRERKRRRGSRADKRRAAARAERAESRRAGIPKSTTTSRRRSSTR